MLLLGDEIERLVTQVVDCGFTVHKILGPGFRESIYERAFSLELDSRGIRFVSQRPIEVRYKQWTIPGQIVDLIVADVVLVEIKSVPRIREIHRLQVRSYLRTLNLRVGLVMNFNATLFKDGVKRVVN